MRTINLIQVWDKWLRLSHWLMAAAIIFLLLSIWLMKHSDVNYGALYDWHIIVGQSLLFVLVLRVILMFRAGTGNWRILFKFSRVKIVEMLKFYLSLGKFPLPNWYAYNPLWAPVYILFYGIVGLAILSGFLYPSLYMLAGIPFKDIHAVMGDVLLYFILLHLLAVIWHDWKGDNATISPMISGERCFKVDQNNLVKGKDAVAVAVDFSARSK